MLSGQHNLELRDLHIFVLQAFVIFLGLLGAAAQKERGVAHLTSRMAQGVLVKTYCYRPAALSDPPLPPSVPAPH